MSDIKEIKKPTVGFDMRSAGVGIADIENEIFENPNDFGGNMTQDSVYDQVKYMQRIDPMLKGFSKTRKNAVLSHKREITGDGPEVEFARDVFSKIPNFQNKIWQLLNAVDVGYAVPQLVWRLENNKYYVDIKPAHPNKFKFDELGNTFITVNDEEKKVEPIKYPVYTHDEEFGNKYGCGEYQALYWYWYIKKESVKFWSIFSERFAVPVISVKKPAGLSEGDNLKLDSFIKNFKAATSVSLPRDVVIEIIEAKNNSGMDTFEKFLNFLDKSIAISYLGQTDTSGVSDASGSYARAKVQNEVRTDIMLADILELETFVNDYIMKPLIDINFSNVKKYPKWHIIVTQFVDAETIKKLVESGNKKIPVKWVNEIFGIPFNEDIADDEYLTIDTVSTESNFSEGVRSIEKEAFLEDLDLIMNGGKNV